jgi:spore germination protein GerM
VKRIAALVVSGLLVTAVAGCGVPTHESATKVESENVPFELLDRDRGLPTGAEAGAEDVVLYFVRDGRLVRATRPLPMSPTPGRVLASLREGPTRAESSSGVRSALPAQSSVRSVSLAGGTATVDLARRFTTLSSSDQLLALAQIVYTLTARPGIGQVRFTLQGESTEVPRANGSLTSNRVSRDDYAPLAPES